MRNVFNSTNGSAIIDNGLRKYMISVFNKMFLALGLTGAVAYLCVSSPAVFAFMTSGFSIVLMIATIGIVLYLSSRINKISSRRAINLFWIISTLLGAFLSPIFAIYTHESIASAFFSTGVFFGGMSLYGYTTKKDLTRVGSFMMIGLFSVIITSLVNIFFMHSSTLELGLSALCVIIFCALTAYHIQKIKSFYDTKIDEETISKRATLGALSLYLDFINLFLALLRLFGNRR